MDFSGLPHAADRNELSDRELRPTRLLEIWALIGAAALGGLAWAIAAWRLDAFYQELPPDRFTGLAFNSQLFSVVALAASAGGVLGLLRGCSLARESGVVFRTTELAVIVVGVLVVCALGVSAAAVPAALLGSATAGLLAIGVPALSIAYGARLAFRLAPRPHS